MTQPERIVSMEEKLYRAVQALAALEKALEGYREIQPEIAALADYMDSGVWLQDYTDDAFGRIPRDLKRGVLSQDALYDMLTDEYRLRQEMLALCEKKTPAEA